MYWGIETRRIIAEGKEGPRTISLSKDEIARRHKLKAEARPHRAMKGVEHLLLCYEAIVGFPSGTCLRTTN